MRLPNKINSYNESIIAKFPIVLDVLEKGDLQVSVLYTAVRKSTDDVGDFMEILDCLYALGKVEFIEKERVLHYVD
jgi:hypothetical protein